MNAKEIEKQITALQHQLDILRNELAKSKKKTLFDDRAASYTLDEIDEIVCDEFFPAEFALRTGAEHAFNGIYLGSGCDECPWEIVKDADGAWVLILKNNK